MIKKHFRLLVIIALVAIGVIAIGSVFAGGGFSWSRVESLIANKMFTKIEGGVNVLDTPEETFGASASTLNQWTDQSGLITYVIGGAFDSSARASTTLISILNPFYNATNTDFTDAGNVDYLKKNYWHGTTTVDLGIINYAGTATTSFDIKCGSSVDFSTIPSYTILDTSGHYQIGVTNGVATATQAMLINAIAYNKGMKVIPTGTTTSILLDNQYPWLTCTVTSTSADWATYGTDELIGESSLLDGTFKFRFIKSQ